MARPTFSPPKAEDRAASEAIEPRRIVNEFGDGYTQRHGDGLNTMPEIRQVSWSKLTWAQSEEIMSFMKARTGGDDAFDWTPAGEAAPKAFICTKIERSGRTDSGAYFSVQASFRQVFDL